MGTVPESIDSQIEELSQSCGDGAVFELRRPVLAARPAQPPLVSRRFVTWLVAVIDEEMTAASGKASKVRTPGRRSQPRPTARSASKPLSDPAVGSQTRGTWICRGRRGHTARRPWEPPRAEEQRGRISRRPAVQTEMLCRLATRARLNRQYVLRLFCAEPHVVVGHEQQGLGPARASSDRFIYILQQSLAFRDVVARVIRR